MMDGRNCSGRKISLLNDGSDLAARHILCQLPPLAAHSRTSSAASTPSLSPQTPHLVRSDSQAFSTPSPLTPSFANFDAIACGQPQSTQDQRQYYIVYQQYVKMDDQNASVYPLIPHGPDATSSAYPMPRQLAQQMPSQQQSQHQVYRTSHSPVSEPSRVSTISTTSNTKQAQKKNQYPCPMAKQVGCTDFFTTSGHAARHAKKHTGKKDAFCPECNKAFTRKDNMEQHRRTHQNGRGASRTSDDAKVKKPTKPASKKPTVKVEQDQPLRDAAIEQQLAEQQQQRAAPQMQGMSQMQASRAQAVQQQQAADVAAMMMPPVAAGPYFLDAVDTGPIPPLPMPTMDALNMRPPLQRSDCTNSLEYVAPAASILLSDTDGLNYSYPSPGLSNGLNSLALAASEHRRLSQGNSNSPSSDASSQGSP